MLVGSGLITTRDECCKGGSTSGLGNYPQALPKSQLGTVDRVVGNQDYVVHMPFRDTVHDRADTPGCERIRRDAGSRRIDRFPGPERHRERWRGFRFNANNLDLAAKPSRNPGNKPATSDRDEEGVNTRALLLHLQPDCSLAQ